MAWSAASAERICATLFTLVGIAGEDDLDAPDLTEPDSETGRLRFNTKSGGNGGQQVGSDRPARRSAGNKPASAQLQPAAGKKPVSAADAQQVEEAFAAKLAIT